jgi:acyl carrier protein
MADESREFVTLCVVRTLMYHVTQHRDPSSEIKPDDRLDEIAWLDSLDRIEVLMLLEDQYKIIIESAEVNRLQTVQDIINLVHVKLDERMSRMKEA